MTPIRFVANTLAGAAFVLAIAALSLLILKEEIPALQTALSDVRCFVGMPEQGSSCVRDQLDALKREREAVEEERERLATMVGAQDFVFVEGDDLPDGGKLVVGTLYEDAAARTGLIRSFCWAIFDRGGLDPRIGLSIMQADGTVQPVSLRDTDLIVLKLARSDLAAVRAMCPFPDISP